MDEMTKRNGMELEEHTVVVSGEFDEDLGILQEISKFIFLLKDSLHMRLKHETIPSGIRG
jgi:hypothetical protein